MNGDKEKFKSLAQYQTGDVKWSLEANRGSLGSEPTLSTTTWYTQHNFCSSYSYSFGDT